MVSSDVGNSYVLISFSWLYLIIKYEAKSSLKKYSYLYAHLSLIFL